jgi:hypothetical protein
MAAARAAREVGEERHADAPPHLGQRWAWRRAGDGAASPFSLGRQSWLARLLFQGGQVGIWVAAEPGAKRPGMAPLVETLAEFWFSRTCRIAGGRSRAG